MYNRGKHLQQHKSIFTINSMDNQPETAWQATDNRLNPKKSAMTAQQPAGAKPAKTTPKLTPKQKLFIKQLVDNPKTTKTKAYLSVYDHKGTLKTANEEASRTARLPQVRQALDNSTEIFESVVVNTAKQWGNSDKPRERELALQASYWGHDKVHGKATQRVEQHTTGVTLTIDLSSSLDVVDDTQQG